MFHDSFDALEAFTVSGGCNAAISGYFLDEKDRRFELCLQLVHLFLGKRDLVWRYDRSVFASFLRSPSFVESDPLALRSSLD